MASQRLHRTPVTPRKAASGPARRLRLPDQEFDDDHRNAKRLAEGLANVPGLTLDPHAVETNIVFFELTRDRPTPQQLAQRLKERGILIGAGGSQRIRLVTHYGIEAEHIAQTVRAFDAVMRDAR